MVPGIKAPAIDLASLVAEPGFAPRAWQSKAPDVVFGGHKPPVASSEDLARIIALPRRAVPEGERRAALVEYVTAKYARANTRCRCAALGRACITRLNSTQAWSLHEIATVGGLLGPIGVGHGKTILDILAPMAIGCRRAVLLVPPTLVTQLIAEYELVGEHFRTPSLVTHGRDYSRINPGAPVLHVFPYSRLSRPESTVWLEQLKPDAIIADECHKLRHADTATTARVLRYFAAHPDTKFCGWSGSLTDSSLKDYAHISALALRERSPLPLEPEVTGDWSRAIDPSDWPAPPGALLELCEPGESVTDGFHRRLVEASGVVHTTMAAVDADLSIEERTAPPIPVSVSRYLDDLRATWIRPDGEELIDALSVARCARELACGFYYRWIFPRGESIATILEWLEARKEWRKDLRDELRDRREHMDSPRLCALAAMRAWGEIPDDKGLPAWKSSTWQRWREVKPTVQPETEAVRVDDYLARDAAQWGLANRGVIWYESRAMGEWIAEISGLPLHGGGPDAGIRIAAEKGDRSIVASIKSHGTGRDGLQRIYCAQLVAQPPSSATTWEQVLGRLHRIGQNAPLVTAEFYRHTPELREHVDSALARALYVQATLGSAQKLRAGFLTKD